MACKRRIPEKTTRVGTDWRLARPEADMTRIVPETRFVPSGPVRRPGWSSRRTLGGRGGAGPVAEPISGDLGVVKGDDAIGEDLEGMAALAGDQDGITGPGIGQRGLD